MIYKQGSVVMEIKQRRGFRTVVAGILCSFLLLALLPVSAAAVPVVYTPLAAIKNGLTYPTDVAVSNSGRIYVVDGLAKKVLVYNSGYLLTGAVSSLENPTAVAAFDKENTMPSSVIDALRELLM